jgi:hypothetical protein
MSIGFNRGYPDMIKGTGSFQTGSLFSFVRFWHSRNYQGGLHAGYQ